MGTYKDEYQRLDHTTLRDVDGQRRQIHRRQTGHRSEEST